MARVFLSYDRDDTERARPLALAMEKAGHFVWWDLHIRGGEQFSKVIDEALQAADAVVVLWSKYSIESPWVRDEAAAGRDSGRLIPVSLDEAKPPLGFRQYQTIDLSHWKGRGMPVELKSLFADVEAMERSSSLASDAPASIPVATAGSVVRFLPWQAIASLAAVLLLAAGIIGWKLWPSSRLPVVEVVAADPSSKSSAAANDLFVKLGKLAQVGQGKWQLIDKSANAGPSDLIFRIADTSSGALPESNLVLLEGKTNSLVWSREFSFPAGRQADLRQQLSLTAGRVLGCALESRQQGNLSPDLLKTFLNACASLADLRGDDYGPIISQLRQIVERVPHFEPGWARLISAEATAVSYAWHTPASVPLIRHLREDASRARSMFPGLPELAIAELRLRDKVDFGRDVDELSAAGERAPENSQMFAELSSAFLNVGRMEDAIDSARRAAELDPLSPGGTTTYIMTLAHGGQIETARRELAKAENLWAGTGPLRDVQLAFHLRYGDPAIAKKIEPEGFNATLYYQARTDPSPTNIAKLKAGIDEFRRKPVTAAQVGWAIQGLGQFGLVDDIYYWLARLRHEEIADISYLLFRPALASARRDARFIPLAKRIGLLEYWQRSGKWPDFCLEPDLPYDCKKEAAKLAA